MSYQGAVWPIGGNANEANIDRRRRPPPRGPDRSGYRRFMTAVLVAVCAVLSWADQAMVAGGAADGVGMAGVVIWALTLVGAFGTGPVHEVWTRLRA